MVFAASLALLALLGTSPGSDLLAHLFGLLLGGAVDLAAALTLPRPVRPPVQWALAVAVLAVVVGAWLRAVAGDHTTRCRRVLGDILGRELDAIGRKELFRRVTRLSGRRPVDGDLPTRHVSLL